MLTRLWLVQRCRSVGGTCSLVPSVDATDHLRRGCGCAECVLDSFKLECAALVSELHSMPEFYLYLRGLRDLLSGIKSEMSERCARTYDGARAYTSSWWVQD
jgi:hypothetical protein